MNLSRVNQPDGFKTSGLDLNVVEVTANGARHLVAVAVSDADVTIVRRFPLVTQLACLSTDQPH